MGKGLTGQNLFDREIMKVHSLELLTIPLPLQEFMLNYLNNTMTSEVLEVSNNET